MSTFFWDDNFEQVTADSARRMSVGLIEPVSQTNSNNFERFLNEQIYRYEKTTTPAATTELKLYLVKRKYTTWCEDYAMVVVAVDEKHAERLARVSSEHFRKDQNLVIEEIIMDKEKVVLVANTGA